MVTTRGDLRKVLMLLLKNKVLIMLFYSNESKKVRVLKCTEVKNKHLE